MTRDLATIAAIAAAAALAYLGWRTYRAGAALAEGATDALRYVNPASTDNVVYRTVNGVGGLVTGNDDFSLGAWLYNATHRDELADPPAPRGAQGQRINNPSAYGTAGVTGDGGAAFGIYPRP